MTGWRVPLAELQADDERTPYAGWAWTAGQCFDACPTCHCMDCQCWATQGVNGELA